MGQETLIEAIRAELGPALEGVTDSFGDPVLILRSQDIPSAMAALRKAPFDFGILLDLTCVDFAAGEGRYELVYHLLSLGRNVRLRIKASVPAAEPAIGTLVGQWKNAEWLEREVYDMFGIRFEGHPSLKRILTYEGFEGHALRKSYPWRLGQPRIPVKDEP